MLVGHQAFRRLHLRIVGHGGARQGGGAGNVVLIEGRHGPFRGEVREIHTGADNGAEMPIGGAGNAKGVGELGMGLGLRAQEGVVPEQIRPIEVERCIEHGQGQAPPALALGPGKERRA